MGVNEHLKALSDPTRREVLRLLRDGDMTAGELADHFDLARSTMSGHFRVLRSAGLVVSERSRNRLVYSINMSALDDAVAALLSLAGGRRSGSDPTDRGSTPIAERWDD